MKLSLFLVSAISGKFVHKAVQNAINENFPFLSESRRQNQINALSKHVDELQLECPLHENFSLDDVSGGACELADALQTRLIEKFLKYDCGGRSKESFKTHIKNRIKNLKKAAYCTPTCSQGNCKGYISGLGRITGRIIPDEFNDVVHFLGIPFAQAPVGNLRFHEPVINEPFAGQNLNARHYGASCLAGDSILTSTFQMDKEQMSEDCLFLNIKMRKNTFLKKTGAPVQFFIHGGSWTFSSNSNWRNQADYLVHQHDMVVVSPNYRLGPIGFWYFPTAQDSDSPYHGNWGILDQRLALKWTNSHIAKFGGNPDQVTLFGFSAGAEGALCHLTHEDSESWGHFNQVLAMGAFNTQYRDAPTAAYLYNQAYEAGKAHCPEGTPPIACLRALPVDAVNQLGSALFDHFLGASIQNKMLTQLAAPQGPVVDGLVVKGSTHDLLLAGTVRPNTKIIYEYSHDEGESFTKSFEGNDKLLENMYGEHYDTIKYLQSVGIKFPAFAFHGLLQNVYERDNGEFTRIMASNPSVVCVRDEKLGEIYGPLQQHCHPTYIGANGMDDCNAAMGALTAELQGAHDCHDKAAHWFTTWMWSCTFRHAIENFKNNANNLNSPMYVVELNAPYPADYDWQQTERNEGSCTVDGGKTCHVAGLYWMNGRAHQKRKQKKLYGFKFFSAGTLTDQQQAFLEEYQDLYAGFVMDGSTGDLIEHGEDGNNFNVLTSDPQTGFEHSTGSSDNGSCAVYEQVDLWLQV